MKNLNKTLLGGAALAAIAVAPAVAGNHPAFSFTALHGGRVVNKTKIHIQGSQHLAYTFSAYATVQAVLIKR